MRESTKAGLLGLDQSGTTVRPGWRRIFAILVAASLPPAAQAANGTWNGTPGNWSDSAIWTGGTVADGIGASALFDATLAADSTVTVDAAITIGAITFTDTGITGFNLAIAGNGSDALTLATGAAAPQITVTDAGRTLTMSGVLAGTEGLAKAGPGRIFVEGVANTLSGTLTLQDGSLQVAADGSLGQLTQITVSQPAELFTDAATALSLDSSRSISLDATLTVAGGENNDRQIAIAGAIGGTGGLNLGGPTTDLTLSGANSFSGPVSIAAGGTVGGSANNTILFVGTGPTDTVSTLGNGSNAVTLGGSGGGTVGQSVLQFTRDDYTFAGAIGGDGRVRIDSNDSGYAQGSTITLTGTNTYTGITEIRNTGLVVSTSDNLAPATVVFNGAGMLLLAGDLDPGSVADFTRAVGSGANEIRWQGGGGFGAIGADRSVNLFGDGRQLAWNTVINANSNKLFLSHPAADATIELVNGLGLTGNSGQRRTISIADGSAAIDAVISGVIANAVSGTNVGLNLEGSGTLQLTGANTYGGGTEILGSTLVVSTIQAGGVSSNVGTGFISVKQGGTLRYTGSGAETFDRGMWVDNGQGRFDIVEPTATVTFDPFQGTRNQRMVKVGAGTMVFARAISGGGSVLVEDGTLELTASNNTYTGSSQITGGTLAVGAAGAVTSSLVQIDSAGSFDVTAKVAGYEVPATQTLSGSGTVVGSLVLGGGATLSPGASPGTLSVSQDTTFAGGGNYNWQVLDAATGGAGQSTGWDLLSLGGSLTITATSVSPFNVNLWSLSATGPDTDGPALNFDPSQPGSWTLVTAPGGISGFSADAFQVVTAAANGTGGFANDLAGGGFSVAQSGNSLNLVFAPVPEPAVAILGATGAAALATAMIRRRRARANAGPRRHVD
jgi:fibronectin-binding autotransporter adhesin